MSQERLTPEEMRLALAEVVLHYAGLAETYRRRLYPEMTPERESTAWRERLRDSEFADEWSDEPLSLAHGTAEMHMRAAQDQLLGLVMLLRSNVEDSIMTLARGEVEACARAAWLLDPDIDAKSRLSRCMSERLAGLDQEAYLSRRIGRALDTAVRVEKITSSAHRKGFETSRNRRGVLQVGTDPYPGQTHVVELLFRGYGEGYGTRAYADLSAHAHSTLAAFTVRLPRLLSPEDLSTQDLEAEPPVERGVVLALVGFDEAMRRYLTLYGWTPGQWHDFVRDAHARLRRLFEVAPSQLDIIRVRSH